MSFDFINPWMLAGLAGVSLPVLAHLLSRRKYDTVEWGAMQFCSPGIPQDEHSEDESGDPQKDDDDDIDVRRQG